MKKIFIVLTLITTISSFGQQPNEEIKFIIVDSLGRVITPDIWIKSNVVNFDKLNVFESEVKHLIVDSIPKHQFGVIRFDGSSYRIGSMIGGHWLDTEYNIKFFLDNQIMNINLITNGYSFSDTITFRKGNFVYLGDNINSEWYYDDSKSQTKLIKIESKGDGKFCSLNCDRMINELDPNLASILLRNDCWSRILIVNFQPIGVLAERDGHLYACYFSDDYIKILRNNYY